MNHRPGSAQRFVITIGFRVIGSIGSIDRYPATIRVSAGYFRYFTVTVVTLLFIGWASQFFIQFFCTTFKFRCTRGIFQHFLIATDRSAIVDEYAIGRKPFFAFHPCSLSLEFLRIKKRNLRAEFIFPVELPVHLRLSTGQFSWLRAS